MISVSGYFYDATAQQKIGGDGNYTIACMAGYNYNIAEALVNLQILEEFDDIQHWAATQYLIDSQPGSVGLNYSATLPDIGLGPIQVPISGTYSKDSFTYDYNNILYWLKIYYEGIQSRSGEAHDIRFCRSDNPDELYLEYNYQKYSNGLAINDGNNTGYIANIKTFPSSESQSVGYAPYAFLFLYSVNVSDVNPDTDTQFYIGCFNMDSAENIASVYKGEFDNINAISVANQSALLYDSGTLCTIETEFGTSTWYKNNDGFGIFIFNNVPERPIYGYGPIAFMPENVPDWDVTMSPGRLSYNTFEYGGITWRQYGLTGTVYASTLYNIDTTIPLMPDTQIYNELGFPGNVTYELTELGVTVAVLPASTRMAVYTYLSYFVEPKPEITPTEIPPEDEPTNPPQPDITDPYYDPTSDPDSPQYDPTKDPENPSYDPTTPHTPYRPTSRPSTDKPAQPQPPIDPIPAPVTPPSYITSNDLFTLYNPSGGDLTSIANFLWSPAWSIDTFKKIFANPLDCILALMVMPQLPATVDTKEMNIGNIPTGINLHYFTSQFYDFDCGTFTIMEYYNSYLDYSPYTKVNIYLPYIGDKMLNTDEVMNKTIGVKYRFDLATGDCVAFITIDGTVMYTFSGNCAARLPLSASNYSGLVPSILSAVGAVGTMSGMPALGTAAALTVTAMKQDIAHSGSVSGSAGLMGVQTPYLIITRPRQAFPRMQNTFTGYPSFITENLGSLNGYTEIESCHLEHIPATADELNEIEQLLKGGVLF